MKKPSATGTTLKKLRANPGKAFFVDMLTRDLSLEDAILDLLDNCVDGALRTKHKNPKDQRDSFEGFKAEISINSNRFSIKDNCGGIPKEKIEYAFMHGRPSELSDKGVPTVGIYGIGMKRAIYKMGIRARVVTKSGALKCEIPFTPEWMKENNDWMLPIESTNEVFKSDGTLIEVSVLRSEVQQTFSIGLDDFIRRLKTIIGEHYAYLIGRGFKVLVNGKPVEGKPVDLQFQIDESESSLRPFFWETSKNGVHVFLTVGFYRPPPKKDDSDDGSEEENWKSEESGWTILCNHRVVAYCDKTHLTGWGDRPIPKFHPQFNAIRGIVVFECDDASKLPTTTTKRGINVGNPLYAEVKNVMKEGMRIFMDSTNKWKSEPDKTREMLQAGNIKKLGLDALRTRAKGLMTANRGAAGGQIYKPSLPEPKRKDSLVWIRYARNDDEIRQVGEYLLSDPDTKPAIVGETCFEQILKKIKR